MSISLNDRLAVPNTPESFQALKPDFEAVAGRLFKGASLALSYNKDDSRKRFSVAMRTFERFDLDQLLANIAVDSKSC